MRIIEDDRMRQALTQTTLIRKPESLIELRCAHSEEVQKRVAKEVKNLRRQIKHGVRMAMIYRR